jgi:uncharacterized protein YtpQ (UPF0354 family)
MTKSICERAMAYVKPVSTDVSPEEHIEPLVGIPDTQFPVVTDLNNGLLVAYLFDGEGDNFTYVKGQHLIDAGWTKSELHERAIKNLSDLCEKRAPLIHQKGDAFLLSFDVNFGASLILLDALWDKKIAHMAPNGFIAAIPNREILSFCDAQSAAGVEQLRRFVAHVLDPEHPLGTHPITSTLYRRDMAARSWRPYVN